MKKNINFFGSRLSNHLFQIVSEKQVSKSESENGNI